MNENSHNELIFCEKRIAKFIQFYKVTFSVFFLQNMIVTQFTENRRLNTFTVSF